MVTTKQLAKTMEMLGRFLAERLVAEQEPKPTSMKQAAVAQGWLATKEVAVICNMSTGALQTLINKGRVPKPTHSITGSKRRWYTKQDAFEIKKMLEDRSSGKVDKGRSLRALEGFYSIAEVARKLGVPVVSFRKLLHDRGLPKPTRLHGNFLCYNAEDIPVLEAWLKANYRPQKKKK